MRLKLLVSDTNYVWRKGRRRRMTLLKDSCKEFSSLEIICQQLVSLDGWKVNCAELRSAQTT